MQWYYQNQYLFSAAYFHICICIRIWTDTQSRCGLSISITIMTRK